MGAMCDLTFNLLLNGQRVTWRYLHFRSRDCLVTEASELYDYTSICTSATGSNVCLFVCR